MSESLSFNEYQQSAGETARYANRGDNLVYPVLGLNGEAGEIAEKVKKLVREEKELTDHARREIGKELGDVLWYLSACADELGISLEEIASQNINKLSDRSERGVLYGDGDNR